MKLFTIHPGASTSTADIYSGVVGALESDGHTLVKFRLDRRITQSGSWLRHCFNRARKSDPSIPKPNAADVLYHAHSDAIIRALHHDCEWVLLFSSMYTPEYVVRILRKAGLKIALVLTESPYNDVEQSRIVRHANIAWTHERASVDYLRVVNPNVYYLPHAYNEHIHSFGANADDDSSLPYHDVVFVGSGFRERVELLSAVDWSGVDFGLYGIWSSLGSRSKLRSHLVTGEVPNEVTASLYRRAKIGLNLFRRAHDFSRDSAQIDSARAQSTSIRTYELAACGRFFLSDPRPELTEIFGDLVPTFTTGEELTELIRRYLPDARERQRISRLLPDAVAGHTWTERARQIVADIESKGDW